MASKSPLGPTMVLRKCLEVILTNKMNSIHQRKQKRHYSLSTIKQKTFTTLEMNENNFTS